MKRLHLFELEDQDWFPSSFRSLITDFLQHQLVTWNIYSAIVPIIEKVLQKTNSHQIIDLCSGSGGELLQIQKTLLEKEHHAVSALLTDKYPNLPAFKRISQLSEQINYIDKPIDATDVPENLTGFRTIFTAFHHFKPELAKKILQDAIDKKSPIGIFEHTERKTFTIIGLLFLAPIMILVQTPFVKPFKWSRLFWTYVIPLAPFFFTWDCIISHLRTYSLEELEELVATLNCDENYSWEWGQTKAEKLPISLIYLVGYPLARK